MTAVHPDTGVENFPTENHRQSILEAIKSRRSVRHFLPIPVSPDAVNQLLEAARWAPTPANLQLRRFVIVESPATIAALAKATKDQQYVAAAPLVIAVLANCEAAIATVGAPGVSLAIQEAAAAVQNMLLVAQEIGLAGCWVGLIDAEKVGRILACPADLTPVALVVLGQPAEHPPLPNRLPIEQISWRAPK
jgi:nitroreductase